MYILLSLRVLVLQVDQHDEEDEEEGLFLQQICHHKVTGERLTTIKLNNGKLYSIQGVKFLFFPIFSYFSQHTPIFPIF